MRRRKTSAINKITVIMVPTRTTGEQQPARRPLGNSASPVYQLAGTAVPLWGAGGYVGLDGGSVGAGAEAGAVKQFSRAAASSGSARIRTSSPGRRVVSLATGSSVPSRITRLTQAFSLQGRSATALPSAAEPPVTW